MTTSIEKSVSLIGAMAITAALYSLCFTSESSAAPTISSMSAVQTVTVSAKHMTSAQKLSYDQEQENVQIQTIVISTKHMSIEEKKAYDKA